MPKLRLKDVTLNYEVDDFTDPWLKNKETVVLHHGSGRNLKMWYSWVPLLSRKCRVIRIDARGFGKSSDPGVGYVPSMKTFASDVIALMDHLEIPQISFVGEHMGGWVGMRLAMDYPERIRKLVVSTPPYFCFPRKADRMKTSGMKAHLLDEKLLRFGENAAFARWYTDEVAKSRINIVLATGQAASSLDYRGELSQIACPVLVILGEKFVKRYDPDGSMVALIRARLNASSEVVVVKGAPLYVLYVKPGLSTRLVQKFFRKKDSHF
jgi:3-oxoadipate enol-lactonase